MKWQQYQENDILSFGIADMDFKSPTEITTALKKRISQGVFGYTSPSNELTDIVKLWLYDTYNWKIETEWIVWVPGVVSGLHIAVRALGTTDDAVVTFIPAYHPFLQAPERFNKHLTKVPLVKNNEHWEIDFNLLEKSLTKKTKLLLFCSPHNPTGRVWTKSELKKIVEVCKKHNLILCSDEVHCEIILDENKKHIPTATLSKDALSRTITFMSASKTYNLAGLNCGFAIIPNKEIRKSFEEARAGIASLINLSGYTATLAAFKYGQVWKKELLKYLRENKNIVQSFLNELSLPIPEIEATYLAWIDIRSLNLQDPVMFFEKAGVILSDGREFGMPGYVRLNFACPKSQLRKGLQRMKLAIKNNN